ncbi:extensin-like domain-containing protein [Paenirhodobacter populi]|uniref:extensin-like domain-containing protein n=1 Tax=Paenirhodobacter populi TaxID=2306993 RepID=UPI001F4F47D1|nr:extensin family protein [Sinirhodobacter populi]
MRRGGRILALLAGLSLPGTAIAAPETSPLPMARPAVPERITAAPDGSLQRPAPRPEALRGATLASAVLVMPRVVGKDASSELCGVPGLTGKRIAPITSRVEGCGLTDGVEVTQVSGIPLSMPAQVDCTTAARLKEWVDRGIVPAVGNRGGGVARLEIAGSYTCRPRNNQSGAKVSEHGRGRAVDLRGIRLKSGEILTVEADWRDKDRLFQRVHAAACGPFGTVLGPESDPYHNDHIHVDTATRNSAYCR